MLRRRAFVRVEIKSFPSNFKVTEMLQHSPVRQKSGYFGLIAIILIVAAALCWGFAHI
jgi:hypothetical protein